MYLDQLLNYTQWMFKKEAAMLRLDSRRNSLQSLADIWSNISKSGIRNHLEGNGEIL